MQSDDILRAGPGGPAEVGVPDGMRTYLYGGGQTQQEQLAGWVHQPGYAIDRVRQLASPSGAVVMDRSYEPFGEALSYGGTQTPNFQFTNEQTDATGLLYLRARYLEPAVGRFLSRDVWEGDPNQPMSFNAWLFAHGDPLNRLDPTGHVSIHAEVVIRYAFRYGMQPEYTIPSTVPANAPGWGRWGRRVDLVDWSRFEIYEVEPETTRAAYTSRHGVSQLYAYLRLMNEAYEGTGIGFVNQWRPGVRASAPMEFETLGGYTLVRSWLEQPGIVLYNVRPTRLAQERALEFCEIGLFYLLLRQMGLRVGLPRMQPQLQGFIFPLVDPALLVQ
jgi:RHS repeat-associated protein